MEMRNVSHDQRSGVRSTTVSRPLFGDTFGPYNYGTCHRGLVSRRCVGNGVTVDGTKHWVTP